MELVSYIQFVTSDNPPIVRVKRGKRGSLDLLEAPMPPVVFRSKFNHTTSRL